MLRKRILHEHAEPVYSTNPSKLRKFKEDNKQLQKLEARAGIYIARD